VESFPTRFPTAGNVGSKADLAMYAVVGFETVPPAPIGANEDRADAGQHTNTGDARRELCPERGFPTARLLERELRDNQANKPPWSLRT